MKAALGGMVCASAAAVLPRAHAVPSPAKQRPRYLVIFQLSGGPDAILTLDPKGRADVDSWVDNPLVADNLTTGAIPLGAHFAPLAKWAPRMAVVHGVRVESVNHPAGSWQLVRMRRRVNQLVPGILDLVARASSGQPLGALTLGDITDRGYTPSWMFDGNVPTPSQPPFQQGLGTFETMDPTDLALLARALRDHTGDRTLLPADRDSYARVAAYVERLPKATKYAAVDWKPGRNFAPCAEGMQRALWALENDLLSGAFVITTRNDWDTHTNNLKRQTDTNQSFVALFDRFLQELQTRSNAFGPLIDNTTVVVSGELGRYPRVNSDKGKDHYPEMSMLFMGAGIRGGQVIGQTGKDMLGVPIDAATGKLTGSRHLVLDDVGTTLLRMFGIEPTQYGYIGRPIEALLA